MIINVAMVQTGSWQRTDEMDHSSRSLAHSSVAMHSHHTITQWVDPTKENGWNVARRLNRHQELADAWKPSVWLGNDLADEHPVKTDDGGRARCVRHINGQLGKESPYGRVVTEAPSMLDTPPSLDTSVLLQSQVHKKKTRR